ncbi:ABC transporter ATP-binding protein [Bosea rubneri]|uniref:ABC transporter ATP-binding protein n=1 Tax=Bosea rubneri TaxID=3075434 RepID=A0ABU3S1M5_9HYPH|nr:ABC transporter ATP-binding protein [Bosea sp. ZW T0_25]MDU0338671.1 ABC transporter ATP-binding protein [Bosea sp. ZW T0_25]
MTHIDASGLKTAGISIRKVNLSYGSLQVLKNVDLEIQPGEFFAFLGPSGCGKTTLLRVIAGFNTPQSGSVTVGGREVLSLPPWKRDVGMVFQSYALWPHMSVRKNVAFGLEERRLPKDEIGRRVDKALELVGLGHLGSRRPSELSGGQQQRVALARTIAIEPTVLLLDEPLSNLDASLRVQVRRDLLAMQRRLGLTTIFVTHDQEEANTICDRIAVMKDGVIQQVGTPMALYDNPVNLFVASFLGTANILDGAMRTNGREQVFELPCGSRFPVPDEHRNGAKLFFRPQNARLALAADQAETASVRVKGKVSHKEFLGASVRYGIRTEGGEVFADIPHARGEAHLPDEHIVGVDVPLSRVNYLPA